MHILVETILVRSAVAALFIPTFALVAFTAEKPLAVAGNACEWTGTLITATNGVERSRKVNEVHGGSWYSTGRSGVSIGIGEGRSARGGYHSVSFRIAMISGDGS